MTQRAATLPVGAQAGYAGPVSRSVAYLLDALLVSTLATGTAAVAGLVAEAIGPWARDLAHMFVAAYVVVLPLIFAIYLGSFWWLAGRTPGMAVLGMRVVTVRGDRVRWPAALIRALVLAYFPIGAVWALVDRRHQGLHDKLARTTVIHHR